MVMSVNSKMAAIADAIRNLLDISGTMGLNAMASNISSITKRGAVAGTISTKSEQYIIPAGYHNGNGTVGIDVAEQAKIIAENIKNGVTILGVSGKASGDAYAVINVTYPAGSVCTCSDGIKTLELKDTGGQGFFLIPYAGAWTVTCTDGTNTKAVSVEITSEGQSESVHLTYPYYLLKDGVFNSSLGSLEKTSYVSFSSGVIKGTQNAENCAAFSFANKITIPNNAVLKMRITQSSYETYNGTKFGFTFGISTSNSLPQYYADYTFSAKKQTNDIVSNFTEYSLDLSSFVGNSFYIRATSVANFTVNQIWFE